MPNIPTATILLGDLPGRDGYQTQAGFAYPIPASDIQKQSDGYMDGQYSAIRDGAIIPHYTVIPQTTNLKTGEPVSGQPILPSASNPYVSPHYGCKGVAWFDGSANAIANGTIDFPASNQSILLEMQKGIFPPSVTQAPSPNNFYITVTLNAQLQLVLATNRAPYLLLSDENGVVRKVSVCSTIPDCENFLRQNDRTYQILIQPDFPTNTIYIEIGSGNFIRYSPKDLSGNNIPLEQITNPIVESMNGLFTVVCLPVRWGKIKTGKNVYAPGVTIPSGSDTAGYQPSNYNPLENDAGKKTPQGMDMTGSQPPGYNPLESDAAGSNGQPIVSINGRSQPNANQSNTSNIRGSGGNLYVEAESSMADAGEGLGSIEMPVFTDKTLIVPFGWSDSGIPGDLSPNASRTLRPLRVEIDEFLDDARRTQYATARQWFNNRNGFANNSFGHLANDIYLSNNGTEIHVYSGMSGVGDAGVEVITTPEYSIAILNSEDASYKMMQGVKSARQYDAWALCDAVRWEAQLGQMHPKYLTRIPVWSPYGGTAAEYGDYDGYILSRGTGDNASHLHLPNEAPFTVLQGYAQDTGDVDTGAPNYMGIIQPTGEFFFGAYSPALQLPVATFGGNGGIRIREQSVINNIANLRSVIDLQTVNPITYELDTAHIDMPMSIKKLIGYQRGWLERNCRFGGNLVETATIAQYTASLNSQMVSFSCDAVPSLHVGQRIIYNNPSVETNDFYIIKLRTNMGYTNPYTRGSRLEATQHIVARNTASFA